MVTLGILLLAIDLLVTVRNLRAPGMAWRRAPIFVWSAAIVCWQIVIIAPVFLAALTMLMIDRQLDGGFFTGGVGGAPLLWQHLSYMFFTGVYMAVAVTMLGAISEIVQTFTRKPLPGPQGSHRVAGRDRRHRHPGLDPEHDHGADPDRLQVLRDAAVDLADRSFRAVFYNLIAAVSGSDFHMRAPLRFAMGALSLASVGLAAEVSQSTIALGTRLQQTYDAWAATHFALIGFAVFGGFAAVAYWYPKMTGRMLDEERAKISFWIMFTGALIALVPLFGAGVEGQVTDSYRFFGGEGVSAFNAIATAGTVVLFVGLILAIGNLVRSRHEGAPATPDPWRGDSLEWLALSPPEPHNFDVLPDVRSIQPMRDIRESLVRREAGHDSPARKSQPVA